MKLPENVKKIIDDNVPPSMRNYYYRMVAKESSGRSDLSSSTGAKGLLQFTRGTGKLYGLVGPEGDKRADPVANVQAGVRLTEDNRRALAKALGRDPTMSELALAHQQGAGTAARMISGVGNASPENLRVNKVDPNATPQQAANKIMAYYGFGDQGQVPGMSLAYNPMLPQLQQPVPTAASPFPPAPVPPPVPPTMTDQIKTALFGAQGGGGKDTGLSDIQAIASGFNPKVNPQVAAQAAQITPMSPDAGQAGNAAAASQLMAALLANKRQKFGLSLTDRQP